MQWLTAYPFATVSTLGFYVLLLLLVIPKSKSILGPLFVHPIPPHQQYLRGFDTLRGFAAAFVAIGHCWWATYPVFSETQYPVLGNFIAYGTKAVPMFAVLSGFLIYRSTLSISNLQDFREYAVRRFFRIYPVYLLGVLLCLLLEQYKASEYFTASGFLISDVFMFTIFSWPGGFANPPTWSLYVEVVFYAFLPITVIVLGRHRMIMFAVIGIIVMIIADYPSRFFALWKYFLIGILASELSPYSRRLAVPLFCSGLVLLIIDLGGPKYDWVANIGIGRLHDDGSSIGLGLACGLILATLPHVEVVSKVLNILPLRLLGVISYSVYITQFFYIHANFNEINLFTQLGTDTMYQHFKQLPSMPAWYLPLVFLPGAFFWGAVSFLLIERPGMKMGQNLLRRSRKIHNVTEP